MVSEAMYSNANCRTQTSAQEESSSSSSSSPTVVETPLSDNINKSSTPADAVQPQVATDRKYPRLFETICQLNTEWQQQ